MKVLRKNQGLTARELAGLLKVDTVEVLRVDNLKLRDVPEPLRGRMLPVLRGDRLDNVPW